MQALGVDLFWMYLVGTASIELNPERPINKDPTPEGPVLKQP